MHIEQTRARDMAGELRGMVGAGGRLAAEATPSGPLALRALDAHSEPDGEGASPMGLRCATATKPACGG